VNRPAARPADTSKAKVRVDYARCDACDAQVSGNLVDVVGWAIAHRLLHRHGKLR